MTLDYNNTHQFYRSFVVSRNIDSAVARPARLMLIPLCITDLNTMETITMEVYSRVICALAHFCNSG